MWSVGQKLTSEWSPTPERGFVRSNDLDRAAAIAAEFLNVTDTVTPGYYGGALYAEKPTCVDAERQAWWDGICSFTRGDSVLCIGRFR